MNFLRARFGLSASLSLASRVSSGYFGIYEFLALDFWHWGMSEVAVKVLESTSEWLLLLSGCFGHYPHESISYNAFFLTYALIFTPPQHTTTLCSNTLIIHS